MDKMRADLPSDMSRLARPALPLRLPVCLLTLAILLPAAAPALAQSSAAPPEANAPLPRLTAPPPLRLRYAIHGIISHLPYRASGELSWAHDGLRYEASLGVSMFLFGSRVQSSQGRLTPGGLQPTRFVDRVRDDRTVDFDYGQSRIRFSEGTAPMALPAGAQDHLSVFMQLGSLVGSAPQRYPAGTAITLPAMGIYGPETWRFVGAGEEQLELPGGTLRTLRFTRAPARGDDPQAEVWLAPELGWLPARIRLTQGNGDVIDQLWRGSEAAQALAPSGS